MNWTIWTEWHSGEKEEKTMEIIEFFTSGNRQHWLDRIAESDWGAGSYLAQLLRENRLKEVLGETALVLLLTEGNRLVSFCTFAPLDDIQPTEFSPWVGFVYTFPEYRGNRYAGKLLDYAECLATVMGKEAIYISTGHTGLYEKYGYAFYRMDKDIGGEESMVYRKILNINGSEKDRRMEKGSKYKAKIIAATRQEIDPVAYCGFSCNHCFLGQWCGGCKSVFPCCSFGTLHEKDRCPNIVCAKGSGPEGCYDCDALETCKTGFYADGNAGANACKAQAIFVKRHGKEQLLMVHDKLHEIYDFQKMQELLGKSPEGGLEILEEYYSALQDKKNILQ